MSTANQSRGAQVLRQQMSQPHQTIHKLLARIQPARGLLQSDLQRCWPLSSPDDILQLPQGNAREGLDHEWNEQLRGDAARHISGVHCFR